MCRLLPPAGFTSLFMARFWPTRRAWLLPGVTMLLLWLLQSMTTRSTIFYKQPGPSPCHLSGLWRKPVLRLHCVPLDHLRVSCRECWVWCGERGLLGCRWYMLLDWAEAWRVQSSVAIEYVEKIKNDTHWTASKNSRVIVNELMIQAYIFQNYCFIDYFSERVSELLIFSILSRIFFSSVTVFDSFFPMLSV